MHFNSNIGKQKKPGRIAPFSPVFCMYICFFYEGKNIIAGFKRYVLWRGDVFVNLRMICGITYCCSEMASGERLLMCLL
jgi:hypothetical protein